jgi:hypothetical protein
MKRTVLLITVVVMLTGVGSSAHSRKSHRNPEAYYQKQWCSEHGGQAEVVLSDATRCDCLTEANAIEFDFAPKWAEAIGQALYYGAMTGKTPGIVLIVRGPGDAKYVERIKAVADRYEIAIAVWTMDE